MLYSYVKLSYILLNYHFFYVIKTYSVFWSISAMLSNSKETNKFERGKNIFYSLWKWNQITKKTATMKNCPI